MLQLTYGGLLVKHLVAALVAVSAILATHAVARATPQLQYVWGGSGCTVVFVHGKASCDATMGDCNSATSLTGPRGYWSNSANALDMMNEATTWYDAAGTHYCEGFSVGYDLDNQGFWYAANDVGACLQDFYQGTNASGCNPSGYQRSQFHVVTHSAGATVMDRLLSTGWYGVNDHLVGPVIEIAPSLAGARAASALYGVDGYSNFCTTLASWLAGWAIKNNGAQSLTRSAVIGEANKGYAGRSPRWAYKVTTTGGGCSAYNVGAWYQSCGVDVHEQDNDFAMGALAVCLGYSSSDDMDGLLYWSDSDPTNNTGANGCPSSDHSCHYYSQFTGSYWHWFESWANHSHSRDDAYTTLGDWQSTGGCYYRSPGTCVGQYGIQ
jgi:hypothetical protein